MRRSFVIGLLALVLVGCQSAIEEAPVPICRKADAPVALASARAFAANGKIYVWGGRNEQGEYRNEIWAYDPASDRWDSAENSPMKACVRPAVCVVDDAVYMGLGLTGQFFIDSCCQREWWRFYPATQQWERLADYPTNQTIGATLHTDGTYIYASFGNFHDEGRDVFRYDIGKDRWQKMTNSIEGKHAYPPYAQGTAGADAMGRHFVGTGYSWQCHNFWAELIPDGEVVRWKELANVPGKGRVGAAACAAGERIFLCGGRLDGGTVTTGENYDDVLCYDIRSNRWTLSAHLPNGARENMVGAGIGGKVYFGLGNDRYNKPCNQWYCLEP